MNIYRFGYAMLSVAAIFGCSPETTSQRASGTPAGGSAADAAAQQSFVISAPAFNSRELDHLNPYGYSTIVVHSTPTVRRRLPIRDRP